MELKPTVIKSGTELYERMNKDQFAYVVFECRTMKTTTAFYSAKLANRKQVLFITSASAIKFIKSDYIKFGFDKYFNLTLISYDSLHKLDLAIKYDYKIIDEFHKICADPKPRPSKRVQKLLKIPADIPTILMSATPDTEGAGVVYWQCQMCAYAPFYQMKWRNWVDNYINVKEINTGKFIVKSYKNGISAKIDPIINKYKMTKTQSQAGFKRASKTFRTLKSTFNDKQQQLCNLLNKSTRKTLMSVKNGSVILFQDGSSVTIKTVASRNNKLHQISGGTIIVQNADGEQGYKLLSNNKIQSIVDDVNLHNFNKVVIVYVYQAELTLIQDFLQQDFTTDIEDFRQSNVKYLIRQQTSIDTGVDLHIANAMYLYSFNYSATTYLQVLERICHADKSEENRIIICLSDDGIDNYIYNKCLTQKKSFTGRHYE
jgi:hypothetical protein